MLAEDLLYVSTPLVITRLLLVHNALQELWSLLARFHDSVRLEWDALLAVIRLVSGYALVGQVG